MKLSIDPSVLNKSHILIVGDIMLDQYLWGNVKRISPEAPVPVLHIRKRSEVLGGAGNVVSNLIGLGCTVTIIGVRGNDDAGKRLSKLLTKKGIRDLSIEEDHQPTVTKTRLVSSGQQLLRLDDEKIRPLESDNRRKIIRSISDNLDQFNALIFSDYGKGILQTPGLSNDIISMATKASIPVFVDPKGKSWDRYKGATCVTPNIIELEAVHNDPIKNQHQLTEAMKKIINKYQLHWLLVTQGAKGMSLMSRDHQLLSIPAQAREVFDVSGAGDTVISVLALGIASGYSFPEAATMANLAAGIVVGKLGTQPVNLFELKAAIEMPGQLLQGHSINKIASLAAASVQLEAWKASDEKVVFTNGCFDLLHPGHIHLLNRCKQLGHRLVVGLNADESVRRLKGASRPILTEQDRAAILGALDCVDMVVLFKEDTPENLIRVLKPDVLAKGSDYQIDEVVGHEIVESYGGIVQTIQLLEGHSTTNITKKMKALN